MSKYEEFVDLINEMSKIGVEALREYKQCLEREKFGILDAMEADKERHRETGVLPCTVGNAVSNDEETIKEATEPKRRGRTKQIADPPRRSSSLKENSREPNRERSRVTGQRKAFREASQMIHNNATANGTSQNVTVKLERLTQDFIKKHPEIANMPIKQEITDMPPPAKPPIRQTRKRKGTRNTDTSSSDTESIQIKEELMDIESKKRKASAKPSSARPTTIRDSDVQITPEPVETVILDETDEEETEKLTKPRGRRPKTKRRNPKDTNSIANEQNSETEVVETARVTRTKARNAAKNKDPKIEQESTIEKQKRIHSSSTEDDDQEKKATKRTKAKKLTNKKTKDTSVYEDALSDIENSKTIQYKTENEQVSKNNQAVAQVKPQPLQVMNETIVLTKPTALNATVVVEKVLMNETIAINKLPNGNQQHMDDLLTDDEDSPIRAQKPKKIKQVFSPYANSPVKKRVEAFERLGAEANTEMPPRMTRTKTKAKEEAGKENGDSENDAATENVPNPVKRGAIPKLTKTPIVKLNISCQPATFSALKASQTEFRERELKRQQKEAEALSKKEALIQAQTEERRRKREERQLKAQQTREALEKGKLKWRESAERQKQEKIKQMKAEKEEKLIKQREEVARKRAHAFKKAAEEKQKEEERKRLEEIKRVEEERKKLEGAIKQNRRDGKIPPYLKYETPLLPTEDCYDSDSSNANQPISKPHWQKGEVLYKTLRYMRYVNVQKQHFYHNGPQTVDLREIFPSIEPHKLKRTSSAIWNKSGLSTLPSMIEENEDLSA